MKCGEQIFRDNAARRMAPFRPGIGEHQMKHCDGSRGEQMPNGVRNLELQNAGVRETTEFDLAARTSHASGHALNSEKVSGWVRRGGRHEKQSIATSKINLQRRPVAVDGLEIKRREIIRRDDFRRVCYRGWSAGHVE